MIKYFGGNIIESIKIDDKTYPLLLRLLQTRTGLNFQYYRRKFIEKRIMARMIRVKCRTLDDYYNYLFSQAQEFKNFIESFNINYTYFFRDWEVYETFYQLILNCLDLKQSSMMSNIKPPHAQRAKFRTKENFLKNKAKKRLDYFSDINKTILPHLEMLSIRKNLKTRKMINIWSCACASGEEPFTLAMILTNISESVKNFSRYKITASDIDKDAILKAITGIYNENSMKEITRFYKTKYFQKIQTKSGEQYLVDEKLKDHVEFINEDITKGHQKAIKYDIIFCRYLMIYFNRVNRDSFIKVIERQLNQGGLLILGKTETLFSEYSNLKLIDSHNQIYLKTK
ncbi:MAG: hypothetical protein EU539_12725 [Promethearchaeota archaeon]|nr:MAG: hypothetical protein EU539_12725 [Candidatus Lokiarchaeota archaeon]